MAEFIADAEPFFTFQARIPPPVLAQLSLDQIAAHLSWWNAANGGPRNEAEQLMAQHPNLRGGSRGGP